jgi:HEAT repeat protein
MFLLRSSILALLLMGLCLTAPAHAYVDLAPTLAKVISDSKKIAVVEVVEFNHEKRIVVLKEIRALKGENSSEPIRHEVAASAAAPVPPQILQWAAPGAQAVLFVSRNTALVCVGRGWYQVQASGDGLWKLGKDRPDLPLAYYGAVSRMAEGIALMIGGKDAILTTVAHGADNEGASVDLALNRFNLPGLVRVQRIRANLRMPGMVMAATSSPDYLIGAGTVDESDLAGLIERLRSGDATVRAAAADDLRCLRRKAAPAVSPLTDLLGDTSPRVRLSAAAALLEIDPKQARAVEVLAQGLESGNLTDRRAAAEAAGLAGPAAGPLADKLASLLKDPDEAIRITALQAIATLGPAAAQAVGAVTPLLDNLDSAIDAADALGRIGSAARPALKRLAEMLSSDQPSVRWAAVRAMSQIGGDEAHPAVDFMIRAMRNATEVDGYNMMIYFSFLGPVAKDAIPTIRSARIKNPMLPSATVWAIESDKNLPWGGGGGGMMFSGMGGLGPSDLIYASYVDELGERLRPAARLLAQKLMDGTAGNVPDWGYKILTSAPDAAIEVLVPHLADADATHRERAAGALGHMGAAAAPAIDPVKAAIEKASSDGEKRLLAWCLRTISK